ncbi:kinase-like domain-containing protein [Coniochaeta sp. 2T2.1]|nr:kinase-like domain-containing protein [Coniochaeta sp. 2T2.1]
MASGVRRRRPEEPIQIFEDAPPSTEDTQLHEDYEAEAESTTADGGADIYSDDPERDYYEEYLADKEANNEANRYTDETDDGQSDISSSSADEVVETSVQHDMEKLQNAFPDFRKKYRLIKRIGEGTFSTVYKAEDLLYDLYDNKWDIEKENEKWSTPPLGSNNHLRNLRRPRRPRPKFVAIKKIYVTSSPHRILNELELLHDLRNCPSVCPLITAFRATDQVIAILPYFRHADFREYYRDMSPRDTAIYLRSLFNALSAVHAQGILHRDIKPTNFLYDPPTRRGVLVDFGLAEREGVDSKPCLCHDTPQVRKSRLRDALQTSSAPHAGYPKNDTRPSRRANRAGTRGFRAPEVLFKCTEQTTKIDIWSVGVILLTILGRRFPFFNSADDVEAMIEIATIFGQKRMRAAGQVHGCMFETNIPTIGAGGFTLERIVLWSTCRDSPQSLEDDERLAIDFLNRCMELDPARRISAEEALEHDFLRLGLEEEHEGMAMEEDEMDILKV